MTVIVQDDHLTAGAWATCALTRLSEERRAFLKTSLQKKKKKKRKKNSRKKFRSETDQASIKKLEKLHVIIKE